MFCQKCRAPLKLDPSIEDLTSAAYDLLIATSSHEPPESKPRSRPSNLQESLRRQTFETATKDATGPVFRRQGGNDSRDAAMSFITLPDQQPAPAPATSPAPSNWRLTGRRSSQSNAPPPSTQQNTDTLTKAQDMARVNKLFEILSARSDIDHPICVECTDLLVEELQKKLEVASRERDAYIGFLKKVQEEQPTPEEIAAQEKALAEEKAAEAEALAELKQLEAEKAALDAELLELEREAQELDQQEEEFWMERNEFSSKLSSFQNDRDSVNSMFDHDAQLLVKLQRSNVFNDTFCISHDGTFATINGLRLGRLSTKMVDWSEINAAWGHALLLLDTVAQQLEYRFVGYELVPMGNTSKIIKLEISAPQQSRFLSSGGDSSGSMNSNNGAPIAAHVTRTTLELFSSGDMPLGLTFMHRKFDNAMVAFLDLVDQLGKFVTRENSQLQLPYKIEGDRIQDYSIKLGIATDDAAWTSACKYTLTCCKYLLAHASNAHTAARQQGQK
ncbi:hypothetical protein TD95_001175 [Thielaviopsis punctulata]|uniref:Autophagy-related protein 6 n=1 Tax=Thielaviopsis punctulata TaxID=72032 RepID=A0A0F4ZHW0_9PEZI|nr:hypothetical protein TD95_001175 [Thielaviopsis punctulata]